MDLAIGFVEDALEWTGFGVRNHLGSKKIGESFLYGGTPQAVCLRLHFFAMSFFCVRTTLHYFFVFGHFCFRIS